MAQNQAAEAPIYFRANQTFECPELASVYSAGFTYTAFPGNDVLRALIPQWESEGKITIGGAAAAVSGKG